MWKENLRRKIISELFDKQTELNQQDLLNMFDKNNKLTNGYYEIIVYKNCRYRKHSRVKSWAAGIALNGELAEEMETIVTERDKLGEDRRSIEAWFRALCIICGHPTLVFIHLPDCLKEYVSKPHTDPTAFTIPPAKLEAVHNLNTDQIVEIVSRRKLTNLLLG